MPKSVKDQVFPFPLRNRTKATAARHEHLDFIARIQL
jgi:hypothetical protein